MRYVSRSGFVGLTFQIFFSGINKLKLWACKALPIFSLKIFTHKLPVKKQEIGQTLPEAQWTQGIDS